MNEMDPEYEKRLERAVDLTLRDLPNLAAPESILPAVMARIQTGAVLPWYRRSWPTWPVALQGASLSLMLALFVGLCYGGWKFFQAEIFVEAVKPLDSWLSVAGVIWRTASVLAEALYLSVRQLNALVLIAMAVVAFFFYAACIGLGTAFFRQARPQENHL